jgi:uncharacterized membrane protein
MVGDAWKDYIFGLNEIRANDNGASMNNNKMQVLGISIFAVGLILTLIALFYVGSMGGISSGMMGGSTNAGSYSVANLLLAIVGSFMMGIGLFTAVFKEEYEPMTDVPPIMPRNAQTRTTIEQIQPVTNVPMEPKKESPTQTNIIHVEEQQLVLRLLTGDERTVFRTVMESGGEALQKDLIIKTKMSDAKISRTLDKLVEKGVISKSRFGMTNKVRVEIEPK